MENNISIKAERQSDELQPGLPVKIKIEEDQAEKVQQRVTEQRLEMATTNQDGVENLKQEFSSDHQLTIAAPCDFEYIRKAMVENNQASTLEKMVTVADNTLRQLSVALPALENDRFLKTILELQSLKRSETIIGIMGDTGAGKSSLLGALLEEPGILPTSCMRACTAVVTKVSWNDSKEADERYRAEIEFITPGDWHSEVKHLFADLIDADGKISSDIGNFNTEAGVAWAKIQSIYPTYTQEMLAQSNSASLCNDAYIKELLGSVLHLKAGSADNLRRNIQEYVDSKRKPGVHNGSPDMRGPAELWPLIKEVRVFLKTNILSAGLALVDLPGYEDSNAARAAVAGKYMEKRTGIWIVAPITRAINNKTALRVLNESLRLQLKYDGNLFNVTFICSKTDDITPHEAEESLDLGEAFDDIRCQQEQTQTKIQAKASELQHLSESLEDLELAELNIEKQLRAWMKLSRAKRRGQVVFPPCITPQKRKRRRGGPAWQDRKRRSPISDYSRDEHADSDDDEPEENAPAHIQPEPEPEPLTREQIETKIDILEDEQTMAQQDIKTMKLRVRGAEDALKHLKGIELQQARQRMSLCIQRRNNFSRSNIKHTFAREIRDLDEEIAERENADDFDPSQIAKDFLVFCVSSRAYQQMTDKVKFTRELEGFATLEETEIPQLKNHAKQLTESGRSLYCRKYLNEFLQTLQSLQI